MALGFIFATTLDRDSAQPLQGPSGERGGLVSTAALPQFHTAALFPEVYADGHETRSVQTGAGAFCGLLLGPLQAANCHEANSDAQGSTQGEQSPELVSQFDSSLPFEPPQLSLVEIATVRTAAYGGQLTEAEAVAILEEAGWPTEVIPEALVVAFCESKHSPYAVGDGGASVGWFQLNKATWFPYAGEDPEQWANPLVNARAALATYRYDLAKGYAPWTQWSCRVVLN